MNNFSLQEWNTRPMNLSFPLPIRVFDVCIMWHVFSGDMWDLCSSTSIWGKEKSTWRQSSEDMSGSISHHLPIVRRHFLVLQMFLALIIWKGEHAFASKARVRVGMQLSERFVLKWHQLCATVRFSLPSVISATLIMCPRAASTLIQLKILMERNEPHSFPHCLTNVVGI